MIIKKTLSSFLGFVLLLLSTNIPIVNATATEQIIFHHTDALSGTSIDTDANGNIIEAVDYYPFGEIRVDQKSTTYENKHKFTGKEFDKSDNLYYYGARYYDPLIGRFINADTVDGDLSNPQSLNKYSYVMNNPLKYVDVTGNMAELVAAAGVTAGGILSALMSPLIIGGAAIVAGIAGGIAIYESSNKLSKATSASQANINTQTKEQTKNESDYITLYRGDLPGKNGFIANGIYKGVIDSVYDLWAPGGLTKSMIDKHTDKGIKGSQSSIFISTTDNYIVAENYANGEDGTQLGMVYTLKIRRDRAIPVGGEDREYLVPLMIGNHEIVNKKLIPPKTSSTSNGKKLLQK